MEIEDNPFCIEESFCEQHMTIEDSQIIGEYELYCLVYFTKYSNLIALCEHCQENATLFCKDCGNSYCMMCCTLRHKLSRSTHNILRLSGLPQFASGTQQHDHSSSSGGY